MIAVNEISDQLLIVNNLHSNVQHPQHLEQAPPHTVQCQQQFVPPATHRLSTVEERKHALKQSKRINCCFSFIPQVAQRLGAVCECEREALLHHSKEILQCVLSMDRDCFQNNKEQHRLPWEYGGDEFYFKGQREHRHHTSTFNKNSILSPTSK
eukprot:m.207476 g.207476  ORF g.207476 m.207476 type:complete len:154 (+) comp13762_c0_seq25:1307-1768(+)